MRGTPWKRFSAALAAAVVLLLAAWPAAAFGWSFAVCGDSRDDPYGIFPRILKAVEESEMEFLIHTGDIEPKGGAASWEKFRARTAGFRKPLHLVIGNHEVRGSSPAEFARFFGLPAPSYSFRHKNAFFAVLDTAAGTLSDATLAWLEKELSAHPRGKDGIDHIVVATHVPPRTDNIFPHDTASDYGARSERLRRILTRHRVELVLSSHEHLHQVDDWGTIRVIVSGGAGARIVPFHPFGFYRVDVSDKSLRETLIKIPKQEIGPAR